MTDISRLTEAMLEARYRKVNGFTLQQWKDSKGFPKTKQTKTQIVEKVIVSYKNLDSLGTAGNMQ